LIPVYLPRAFKRYYGSDKEDWNPGLVPVPIRRVKTRFNSFVVHSSCCFPFLFCILFRCFLLNNSVYVVVHSCIRFLTIITESMFLKEQKWKCFSNDIE
jgi:hypothetical protein